MTSPVPGHGIGTHYGVPGRMWAAGHHTGVDFPAPTGARVVAAVRGTVVHAGWGGWGQAYGNHVIVQHGNRCFGYMHLSKVYVRQGQHVEVSAHIGDVGTTGNSTGPHLHFEVRHEPFRYGDDVDPMPYVKDDTVTVYVSKLRPGAKDSKSVHVLRKALVARGLIKKTPSGRVGNDFNAAAAAGVTKWQKRHGHRETGELTVEQAREFFKRNTKVRVVD